LLLRNGDPAIDKGKRACLVIIILTDPLIVIAAPGESGAICIRDLVSGRSETPGFCWAVVMALSIKYSVWTWVLFAAVGSELTSANFLQEKSNTGISAKNTGYLILIFFIFVLLIYE